MGGVFICYRRDDSGGYAGRIYDRLASRLGPNNVFIDVHDIQPGVDFVDVLSERVGVCDALVAVIGKNWISSPDKNNQRRLDDPNDFVRVEIEAALERGVRVVPVLVDGATMPKPEDLPDRLKKLARRQGIEISLTRFDADAERLTQALASLGEELRQRQPPQAEHLVREEPRLKPVAAEGSDNAPDYAIQIVSKTGTSLAMDIALGVVGAIVGGLIASAVSGMNGVSGVNILSIIVSVIGAVIVLWVYHKVMAQT